MENALAALHASMALQRLSQAASALLCKRKGTVSARALANAHRNPAVSLDHRPSTSAARTTKRARPPSPESSGYTRSFLLRAASRAAPS